MDQVAPRAPLLGRLPVGVWQVLTWGAAAAFAVLLDNTMSAVVTPVFQPPHQYLRLAGWVVVGMAVAMAAPLGLARRWPLPVLGLVLAETVLDAMLRERQWPLWLAADVLVCHLAANRPRRTSLTATGVTLIVGVAAVMPNLFAQFSDDIGTVPLIAFPAVIAWMIGNSVRQRRDYGAALRAQAAESAVTAERLRIAREVHDIVAHSIGVIAIQAGVGCRVIGTQPVEARNALSAIETTARDTLAGLQRMLGGLRRAEPEPVAASGLADIDRLASTMGEAGIRVQVRWLGDRSPLPPAIELSAFRIIQEALTNVIRHANAQHCEVRVDYRDEELAIEVLDDGRGGTPEGTGYGLVGMRERTALVHGSFSAGPRPEGGFRVAARLPR